VAAVGGWDAAAWRLARVDRRWRAPVAAVLLCDGAIDPAALRARVAQRRAGLPVLRSRLVESGRSGLPQRIDDDTPLAERVTARIVPDAGADGIMVAADDLLERVLTDPGDPGPWGMCVVGSGPPIPAGPARRYGGDGRKPCHGLIVWFNHALTDAHGALQTVLGLTDEGMSAQPDDDGAGRPGRGMQSDPLTWLPGLLATGQQALRMLRDDPIAATQQACARADHWRILTGQRPPVSRPWPVGSAGSVRATTVVPLAEIREAVERLRSVGDEGRVRRLNDLLIAAVTVSAWELTAGSATTVNVPIRLPSRAAGEAGNHLTAARLVLHPGTAGSPAQWCADLAGEAAAQVHRWRTSVLPDVAEWLAAAGAVIPVGVLAQLAGGADLTVSNVRGPAAPVHLLGRRVVSVQPLVPPLGSGISVGLLTYAGQARLGCAVHSGVGVDPGALLARAAAHLTGRAGASAEPADDTPQR